MSQFIENLQYRIKTTSGSIFMSMFKLCVGLMLGLTFSLIGQQMINYGKLAFFFVIIATVMAFHRLARGWKWSNLLVFTLICVLIGVLLQMYIQIAPGA